ncbi:MAG TPA: hypothetical protein VI670_16980 [Thermoanaerobaculia bacterium]|jgi:hypothetical protein
MKTFPRSFAVLAILLTTTTLPAQTSSYKLTDGTSVQLPDLTVTGSTVTADVSYDAARAVYRYSYAITAPVTNLAPIRKVLIDLSGKVARPQLDPTLAENIRRWSVKQPATTIPVGITVQDLTQWGSSSVAADGRAYFMSEEPSYALLPGTSKSGFVLESKQPPGLRRAWIVPSMQPWVDALEALPPSDAEFVKPLSEEAFAVATTTVGPADLTDADLYDGGGQQPAEVNKFLRYASPLDNRVKVSANTTYTVIVRYGQTITPATFAATLDGVDVTARFHPVPGGADAVMIAIGTSTTKLHLSVDGTKASGGKGTDTDTLTFLPQ